MRLSLDASCYRDRRADTTTRVDRSFAMSLLVTLTSRRAVRRALVAGGSIGAFLASGFVPAGSASLQSEISAGQSQASSLRSQISAESSQIASTAGGLASARQRLAGLQTELEAHISQLKAVQTALLAARMRLLELEERLDRASTALASNLRASYEAGSPDLMTVILDAHGFSNLLEQVDFAQRVGRQDAQIVGITRRARVAVTHEALRLGALEERDRTLTDDILAQRNEVAALQAALVQREISEESARASTRTKLASVNTRVGQLQTQLAAQIAAQQRRLAAIEARAQQQAQQTPTQVNQSVGGVAVNTGGMVQAPADAPEAVKEMIAAGNAIATLPYIWGGGHGSFQSPGYDCSGSVSYVLNAAGLLSSPLDSAGFASYGDPGSGQWVTIWDDPGVHVWMTIAGWRFDTVALAEDGTRWAQGGGEFAGFEPRHPPGL